MTELRGRALALEALRRIEADPKSWDQSTWHCGTTCCFAGHVALAAGYTWVRPDATPNDVDVDLMESPDGREEDVTVVAARFLGLTDDDESDSYWDLFGGSRDLADLRYYVDKHLPAEPS